MITSVTETDPVRKKILAATDRLLAGTPLRSTGRLSVSQLAVEADVGRWHLTHQHLGSLGRRLLYICVKFQTAGLRRARLM
jgi:hypothetical protein